MDYSQEQFFRMQQFDTQKIPFYMSYPMQNLYLTEMEYEKDMDRMKELYPREVKRISEFVEEECDKMEYEGSLMFDEYPDRMMMERITDRILKKVSGEKQNQVMAEEYWNSQNPTPLAKETSGPPPFGPPSDADHYLRGLIGVMLNNEMYRRRCRHRRCRRWW